jgi:hypothetical protein
MGTFTVYTMQQRQQQLRLATGVLVLSYSACAASWQLSKAGATHHTLLCGGPSLPW